MTREQAAQKKPSATGRYLSRVLPENVEYALIG